MSNDETSNATKEAAKGLLDTFRTFFTIETQLRTQGEDLTKLSQQVDKLADNLIALTLRVVALEKGQQTSVVETKQVISDFIYEFRNRLTENALSAEREENVRLKRLLEQVNPSTTTSAEVVQITEIRDGS